MKMAVGFIGLGLMGKPMAWRILKAGFPLFIYNRTPDKTVELAAAGASVTGSPVELAERADVVVTCVTDGPALEAVLFNGQGVTSSSRTPAVIDMSTIGKQAAVAIAGRLKEHGNSFLDAPVTGGTAKAATGELTIFVGGDTETLESCREVLAAMGTNIVHMGPTGSGQAIKLINNFLLAAFNEAMMEGMLLADGMGLPRQKVADGLINTPNLPEGIKKNLPEFIDETFPATFTLSNMRKDLGLAVREMKQAHETLPSLTNIEALFGKANEDPNLAQGSYREVMQYVKRMSGLK